MLTEQSVSLQRRDEPTRRWYADDFFDLIVWCDDADSVVAFELCYDKLGDERVLRWSRDYFTHMRIDSGESEPLNGKQSPILIADGAFDAERIVPQLVHASTTLEHDIQRQIMQRLGEYLSSQIPPRS